MAGLGLNKELLGNRRHLPDVVTHNWDRSCESSRKVLALGFVGWVSLEKMSFVFEPRRTQRFTEPQVKFPLCSSVLSVVESLLPPPELATLKWKNRQCRLDSLDGFVLV